MLILMAILILYLYCRDHAFLVWCLSFKAIWQKLLSDVKLATALACTITQAHLLQICSCFYINKDLLVNMFLHCIWDRFSIFIPFHCLLGKFAWYLHRLMIPPPKNTIKFKQIGSSACLSFWIWTICKGLSADDTSKQREKTGIPSISPCVVVPSISPREGVQRTTFPVSMGVHSTSSIAGIQIRAFLAYYQVWVFPAYL